MSTRRRSRSFRRKRASWPALSLTAAISFVLGIGVGYLSRGRAGLPTEGVGSPRATSEVEVKRPDRRLPTSETRRGAEDRAGVAPAGAEPRTYPRGEGSRVALVIDDLGRSLSQLEDLRGLGVAISYAVLPYEPRTAAVVDSLRQRGEEILCHLPMEPSNGADPGPGALSLDMTPAELAGATRGALEQVPGAVGVNNHMGSGLAADRRSMRAILGVLAEAGLFYLDSRTRADSLGYRLALEAGVPAAERQVFLDTDSSPEGVREQFDRLLALARGRGAAIAIGHPSATTLEVLRREIPRALEAGYEFVPVSYLLDRMGVLPEPG